MTDSYLQAVLDRAASLRRSECAGEALLCERSRRWHAWLAAALAALMSLIPSVSAAAPLL